MANSEINYRCSIDAELGISPAIAPGPEIHRVTVDLSVKIALA
jgi:hypothetical protein